MLIVKRFPRIRDPSVCKLYIEGAAISRYSRLLFLPYSAALDCRRPHSLVLSFLLFPRPNCVLSLFRGLIIDAKARWIPFHFVLIIMILVNFCYDAPFVTLYIYDESQLLISK